VVRDGAETQTILKELARILHEELNCDLEFAKEDREREVIVASGAYAFTPVPDVEGNEQIHLFADVFDLNSGAGGSVGTTIPEFLRTLKDRIGQRIIDETTPTSEKTKNICFHPIQSLNEARAKAVTEKDEKDLERLRDLFLANVTKQTGLQFSIERRTVPVWTIAGDRATVRLPAKNMAQVSSEPPAPAKPDAPPPDAFALKCDAQVVDPFALAVTPSSPRNRFQGQVVGEDGKPLAGVLVNAWTWCPGNEATTDADGVFSLDDFDADQKAIEVRFSKEGYSPVYMFRQPLGRLAQPLAMTTRTYLDGKVVDSQGRPVPNAIIRVDGGPRHAEGVMLTDTMTQTTARPDGAYRIYVQHGVYQVTATDGREMAVMSNVIVAKDEAKPLDIQLSPAPVFRAKVVDSITGAPVEGLRLFSWRLKEYEGTSNADGEIVISGMPTGKFRFDVDAEKRDITRWWSEEAADKSQRYGIDDEKTKWQRNFDDLAFDLEKDMTPVTITLEKGVRICGTVVDPDGKPVEGATVSAARTGTSNSLTGDTRFSVRSDKDGNFDLLLPASKSAQYNLICHDGDFQEWRTWANGAAAPMTTQPGDVKEGVVLQLQRPCIMRGKVVDDQGSPIVDREVRACAFDKNDNRYYVPESRTDKDGIFELKYVAPGKHFVQAAPFWLDPEKAPEGTSQIIEITQEKPVEGIVLKSTPETGVASTTATETDGKPSSVADATSPAPPADGTPGATGGNEDNAAQQTNRGKITGVVTGPDGQPIAGAYVGVGDFGDSGGSNHDRHRQEGLYANAKTDDQGRFTLDGLAFSDAHPLFVTHPDYIRHDQQITLSESQPSVTIGCQLEPAARINVTVVDSAGAPAPGQYLFRLKDAQGFRRIPPGMDPHLSTFASTAWTRGPREGAFSFTELPAGDYLIDVICAAPAPERVSGGNRRVLDDKTTAYYGGSAASPVKAGQIWDLEITPQEHGTRLVCTMPANDPSSPGFLRIFAIGRSSELPFEAKAKIRSLEDPKLGRIAEGALFHTLMKTDSFTVANLPPGEYTIFAGPILELDGARVQLAPGQDVMVDLPVKPGASEQSSAQPRYDKINPRGGAVVDGLQVVLRTEKERWALGERPEMIADFLVVGEGATWMEDLPLGVQFECDGVQYAARAAGRPSAPALFGRGSLYDFRGLLDSELVDSKDQALTLTPGRHTIRLAIPSVILKGPESARSLVFSNPVSIVIG
jgi:protocatechuate 3,4-dioxygenase beta subunit